ncbi:MAG TPA: hypothetical protein VFE05_07875 [Longimicrobiaceae bacterium]|jgi:hypothetical protein|nr:hypothetical protein [Longimicrobiaceae bacterium]
MLAAALLLSACGDSAPQGGEDAKPASRSGGSPAGGAAPSPASPVTRSADAAAAKETASDGDIPVDVVRTGRAGLSIDGRSALPSVQVSVEDGHRVLFGPTDVPVQDGRFHVDVPSVETDQAAIYAYVADPSGAHQTVVRIPRGVAQVRFTPALPRPTDAKPEAADRRTGESRSGVEGPHFKVVWPKARPGDRAVRLEGMTALPRFRVAVERGGVAVGSASFAKSVASGDWRTFVVRVPVKGGVRPGDRVVLPAAAPYARELVFPVIR